MKVNTSLKFGSTIRVNQQLRDLEYKLRKLSAAQHLITSRFNKLLLMVNLDKELKTKLDGLETCKKFYDELSDSDKVKNVESILKNGLLERLKEEVNRFDLKNIFEEKFSQSLEQTINMIVSEQFEQANNVIFSLQRELLEEKCKNANICSCAGYDNYSPNSNMSSSNSECIPENLENLDSSLSDMPEDNVIPTVDININGYEEEKKQKLN